MADRDITIEFPEEEMKAAIDEAFKKIREDMKRTEARLERIEHKQDLTLKILAPLNKALKYFAGIMNAEKVEE